MPSFGIKPQESVDRHLLSSRFRIYGSLALLLFASTLQAVHTCGSQTSDAQVSLEAQSTSGNLSPCLACILQASLAILLIEVSLCGFAVRASSTPIQFRPRVLLS